MNHPTNTADDELDEILHNYRDSITEAEDDFGGYLHIDKKQHVNVKITLL